MRRTRADQQRVPVRRGFLDLRGADGARSPRAVLHDDGLSQVRLQTLRK